MWRITRLLGLGGDWFIELPTHIHVRGWRGWRFTSVKLLGFGVIYDHRPSSKTRFKWVCPHWDSQMARQAWLGVLRKNKGLI